VHVLSVSSLKGGVGKTTVALGLASAAFAKGLKTLVVDLDPQCDATTGLGAVGEFKTTVASVLKNPKHNVVSASIVSSSWGKVAAGNVDVMVGSPRSIHHDTPHPTVRQTWKLEEALHNVEKDYDLVIIDTPPSINALTRTAWVASDRVLIVTEPGIFSVVAADRAIRALEEVRTAITKRVRPLGILINRHRPASKEQDFRVQELGEMFPELLIPAYLEERAHLQQTQGAARPIHTWPGEGAIDIAEFFTDLLDRALLAFEEPNEDVVAEKPKEKRRFFRRHKRGKKGPELVTIEAAIEELGEDLPDESFENTTAVGEPVEAAPEQNWSQPAWQSDEEAAKQQEVSTNTGGWNFKLEIEEPEEKN
jgi:cellulose biosynthesis protein BcsQ